MWGENRKRISLCIWNPCDNKKNEWGILYFWLIIQIWDVSQACRDEFWTGRTVLLASSWKNYILDGAEKLEMKIND